jgi:hypothetical protein
MDQYIIHIYILIYFIIGIIISCGWIYLDDNIKPKYYIYFLNSLLYPIITPILLIHLIKKKLF